MRVVHFHGALLAVSTVFRHVVQVLRVEGFILAVCDINVHADFFGWLRSVAKGVSFLNRHIIQMRFITVRSLGLSSVVNHEQVKQVVLRLRDGFQLPP